MKTLGEAKRGTPEARVEFSKKRFDNALKTHEIFVKMADKAINFMFNKQWSDEDVAKLEKQKRPALTINRILPMVNTVYGEFASMRTEFFFKSVRGGGALMASKLSMLCKHVMRTNNYEFRERTEVFLAGLLTGRGFLEVSIGDEVDPLGGVETKQYDSRCVVLPPSAKTYDPRSWPEVFTVEKWSYDEIQESFGVELADEVRSGGPETAENLGNKGSFSHAFDMDDADDESNDEDGNDQFEIIVHEYRTFRKVWRFLDEATGDSYDVPLSMMKKADAEQKAAVAGIIVVPAKQRAVRFRQFSNGVELRSGWLDSGEFSIVPYFPYFFAGVTMGMVEPLMSPQEQLNKLSSQELHIINTTANSGWQVEEGALVSPTPKELEERGAETGLVIVRRRGTMPLDKITPNSIPSGIVHAADRSAQNMLFISNVNEGAMGHTGVNIAGKTVQEKKASMVASMQIIMDNFKFTEVILSRVVLANIQAHYTEPRVFRIIDGPQDSIPAEVAINSVDEYGRIIDDVTLGKYDVTVAFRPQQDVQNDAEFAELMEMKAAGIMIPDHQIVARSHVSNADEIAREMRILAGLEQTPEQQQKAQVMEQMAMADMQITLEGKKMELAKMQAETDKIICEQGLDKAKTQDILVGQNQRLAAELAVKDTTDQRGAMLRDALSRRSADTTLATNVMRNSSQKEIVALQNMFDMAKEETKPTEKKESKK